MIQKWTQNETSEDENGTCVRSRAKPFFNSLISLKDCQKMPPVLCHSQCACNFIQYYTFQQIIF